MNEADPSGAHLVKAAITLGAESWAQIPMTPVARG